jgi:hypothetical protein
MTRKAQPLRVVEEWIKRRMMIEGTLRCAQGVTMERVKLVLFGMTRRARPLRAVEEKSKKFPCPRI